MSLTIGPDDQCAIEALVAGIAAAWNAGSGRDYARAFAEDADFINIYGMHGRGKQNIADAHDRIFQTVYAGSVLNCRVVQVRLLREDVAIVHIHSDLRVPQGPLAGEMESVPSMVDTATREPAGWTIAAFHNTLVKVPPALHNHGQPG